MRRQPVIPTACAAIFLLVFIAGQMGCFSRGLQGDKLSVRGKYLVELGGCVDCHSPKTFKDGFRQLDYARLFAGHPEEEGIPEIDVSQITEGNWILSNQHFTFHVGPWGATFAANLTPDREYGIGSMSAEQFVLAVRSRHRLPMPTFSQEHFPDHELEEIYSYLMTLPPVKNRVPNSLELHELKARLRLRR